MISQGWRHCASVLAASPQIPKRIVVVRHCPAVDDLREPARCHRYTAPGRRPPKSAPTHRAPVRTRRPAALLRTSSSSSKVFHYCRALVMTSYLTPTFLTTTFRPFTPPEKLLISFLLPLSFLLKTKDTRPSNVGNIPPRRNGIVVW